LKVTGAWAEDVATHAASRIPTTRATMTMFRRDVRLKPRF
jgi:hypothetical protein